jgi:hypothetical protein
METPYAQSAEHHTRFIPLYHGVAFGILAINFLWTLYRLVVAFSWGSVLAFGLAVALLLIFAYARAMAVSVQDRVIRLEERLRWERLLPADLKSRFDEFTLDQIISLRFAGDAELADLARRVFDEKLTDRKVIKKMIKNWRPDFLRA